MAADRLPPRLLVVSYLFPPQPEPRAIQVGRLVSALKAETVLVCGHDPQAPRDPTVAPRAEDACRELIRVPLAQPAWQRRLLAAWARRGLPLLGQNPDRLGAWRRPALAAALAYLEVNHFHPRALLTFAHPWSDHLVGLKLKQTLGLPWLAHFSDPWANSPFRRQDPLTRALNRRLERRVVETADRLLFPFPELAELVLEPYPPRVRDKVRILPPCFDPDEYPGPLEARPDKRVLRFLGTFYGPRDPRPLLTALERLVREQPRLVEGLQVELIGPNPDPPPPHWGLERLPPGLVVTRPAVDHRTSLGLMQGAEALLTIDAPHMSVFPAKLADYIGAARPILGITPPGPSAQVIRELGGWVAHPRHPREIQAMLADYLGRPPAPSPWGEPRVRARYQARAAARRLEELLAELGEGGQDRP